MSGDKELNALIGLIYEAVLDGDLWPDVLIKFADAMGAAQIALPSFDRRANIFSAIAPRIDPDLLVSYKEYWAFNEPVVPRAALLPAGQVYTLDNLMPREEFQRTPVFNEWWRPAGCGVAAVGANLIAEEQFSALLCIFNAPGRDSVTAGQIRTFETVLPHMIRAVRVDRRLRGLELKRLAPPELFEAMPQAALLADSTARVVLANAAAKAMLDAGHGITLCNGRLAAASGPHILQAMIASCGQTSFSLGGQGGALKAAREPPASPLHVIVTPLRSKAPLKDIPWIGVGTPVALVTVDDPDFERRQKETKLRRRFDLTSAEAGLAVEILKGDGRKAAALRRGISDSTAKTQLSSIFEKTGTRRQAELVRRLLDAASAREME